MSKDDKDKPDPIGKDFEALQRAVTQATQLPANVPGLLEAIRNATKTIQAINTPGMTEAIRTISDTRLSALPKLTEAVAGILSLPKLASTSKTQLTPDKIDDSKSIGDSANPVPITASVDLGSLVREARERRSLSQQTFADLAGVGRRFVSELENGKPTLEFEKVVKVARAAGISLFAVQR